jgi:hypothetical protein
MKAYGSANPSPAKTISVPEAAAPGHQPEFWVLGGEARGHTDHSSR